MGSTENIDMADIGFQGLLERYLKLRTRHESTQNLSDHLDEDTLNAFTEGNLIRREAGPVVSHLADCSFCRHKTADLVRLDMAFAPTDESAPPVAAGEPSKVSDVITGIISRLFGGSEAAVFAHEEKPENKEDEKSGKDEKEK